MRSSIPFNAFTLPVFHAFDERWLLLTTGENRPSAFNMMTVSWGGLGVIWGKPLAIVVVRPSRYTYELMEKSATFTLSAFPSEYKDQLTLCGTRSGRATDKVAATGLTPIASSVVPAPGFEEAELIIECRKQYYDDLKPEHFLSAQIESNYGGRDYHRMYFGEIVAIQGTDTYRKP